VTDSSTPAQSRTATHTVTVAATLTAAFTSSPAAPTAGQTVTFTSTVTGGTTPYVYAWTFGDAGTSNVANPTHAYATAGTYTVTLTVTDASTPVQSATATHTVIVSGPLVANFTSSPTNPIIGGTVTFTSTVSGGTTPYTYSWTFGDGGTSTVVNPTHAYATAGTFTVALTVRDASTPVQSATASHTVTVASAVSAAFTSSPAFPTIGQTVTFTSTVSGGTTPYTYSWTFGDSGTSTVANPTHAYATAGTFTVALTVTDSSTPSQTATVSHTVTVSATLVATFTSSPAHPVVGGTVTFTSTVTGGKTPYVYAWTFGDGATSAVASPTHAYTAAGTFTVTLTVTDASTPAQSSTATNTVTIAAVLAVNFTISPTSANTGQTVSFTSTVTGGTTPFTYSWTFGDGGTSTVANPTHVYTTASTFTVTLSVTDFSTPAQTKTATHTITVVTPPPIDFRISASPTSVGPLAPGNASDGQGGTNAAPNATSTITVTAVNGFTGTITLTLAPSAGLNAFLNVSSITLTSTKTVGGALLIVNSNLVGNYVVTITGTSGSLSHPASVSVTVVDFKVNASPLTIGPLKPSQVGSTTVTVTGLNGISTSVSVSRNPGGTTGGLTLSTCALTSTTTTCTGTLTVSSDVAGVYQVIVDAVSNVVENNGNLGSNTVTVDHQVTVTVTVQDFAISASPTTIGPQSPGATGTSTITVTALDGFTGTVTFSTSPSSTHLTATVAPTSVTFTSTGPTSLTATLSVSFDQLGTYFVLVNGASTGYPSHSVRVHVISPATVLVNPLTQGLAAPGSTVSYSVNVVSMPLFAGYDVSVQTNNAVLSPNSIDTSATMVPGFFETINCVNGGFDASGTAIPVGSPGNLNCGPTDGPGIAHSAGSSISGFTAGDGVLFTINYIAGKIFTITASPGALGPLAPANASDGQGGTNAAPNATSTVNLSLLGFGTSVTVFNDVIMDPNGVSIAHNTQGANYGISSGTINLTLTSPTGLNAYISATSITLSSTVTSGTAIITVNSNLVGNYNLLVTGTFGTLTSHSVTITVTVVDFNVNASPLTVGPLRPSQIGSSTVTVTGLNGITTSVSVSRNPGGTTGTLTLSTCALSSTTTTCTGTLTVSSDVAGVYLVVVDATANVVENGGNLGSTTITVDHQVTVTVTVTDFAISANPTTIGPLSPGATGTSTITVTALDGFTGTVTFSTSPSSTHLTASVAPTSVTFTSGGPTTLTATLSVSFNQLGTYFVLVNGASTGYPTHSVRVHVISPATVLVNPLTQGLAAPGSTVSYSVNVVSMPAFAGYDISVQTNNAVLSPNTIDTSATIVPGFFETINCVNGGFYANGTAIPVGSSGNLNCGSTDGPGIAHSAGASISGFTAGDGVLFTINYIAGNVFTISANPTSLGPLVPANASDGAGGTNASPNATSTVNLSLLGFGTSVTVFNDSILDPNGVAIAHNTQNANYGVSSGTVNLTLTPSAGLNAYISQSSFSVSGTATVTVNSNLAGNYNLIVTGTFGTLTSHSVTITVTVVDFNVNASPLTVGPLRPNQIGSTTVTVTGLNGITTSVSVSRNPGGTTGGLTLSTCSLTSTATICTGTLTVSSDVAGVYLVVVDATANVVENCGSTACAGGNVITVDHQVTVIVTVTDFAISASPTTIGPQSPGATGTSTITVTALQGFTGTVSFVLTTFSTHVTASISPTSVTFTSGGPTSLSATLSVRFDQLGTYAVLVNGSSTGYPSHSVRVHVISPATIVITPLTQGLATPGSTVSYSVGFISMPTFAGYDISVQTNNAVLSPNSIDTSGSTIPGFFETVNCVNGGIDGHGNAIPLNTPGNLNCGPTDGPGIAHSAGSSTSGFVSGDGQLFTINYIAGATDFSISASPSAVNNLGVGQTGTSTITISTVTPSSTALTITNDLVFDTNGNPVTHNIQNASYGTSSFTVSLSLTPSSGLTANISPTSVTLSSTTPTATATLSFSASTNGNYNVFVSGTASGLPNAPSHSLTVTVQVTDFTVTASPSTIAPPFGVTSGSSTITVTGLNGFTGTVTLTLAPSSGLTASITPTTISLNSGTTSRTATLQVSATSSGTYTVIVTGSSPSFQSRTVKVTVIIQISDFKITASPNFFTASHTNGKGSFTSTISVTSIGSFSGTVTLSATITPSSGHQSLSFSTTSLTLTSGGRATATLQISFKHSSSGTYTITVTGTSGATVHTTTITVVLPSNIVSINSVTATSPLSIAASGGMQTWTVSVMNTGSTTQYVQVVISGVSTTGSHAFTAQSTVVAVASGATVNITVQTPANTFTGADIGRTFSYSTLAFFGSTSTNLNQVSRPASGSFSVVA
jgi:PKD repeat protein